jgi:hypothetical protein
LHAQVTTVTRELGATVGQFVVRGAAGLGLQDRSLGAGCDGGRAAFVSDRGG